MKNYGGYIDVKTGSKHKDNHVFSSGIWFKPDKNKKGGHMIVVNHSDYSAQRISKKQLEKMLKLLDDGMSVEDCYYDMLHNP